MKPTIAIIQDTRSPKKTGKYPIKLRVTFQRYQIYYPTRLEVTKEDFHFMQNPSLIPKSATSTCKRGLKAIKIECDKVLVKANAIIEQMPEFNHRLFKKRYNGSQRPENSLIEYYELEIASKKARAKVGTASNYQSSLNSLKTFSPKLSFSDISVEFLREYENWLLGNGKSLTTVGIYLRPLRALLIKAIEDGCMSKESYPFGKRKYQIPTGMNVKKALTQDEIGLIYNYEAIPNSWFQKARDFFIFSYLASGMNMKDILQLKNGNLDGDFIRFIRAKTQGTNRSGSKPISVPLTKDLEEIIDRWRKKSTDQDEFIFGLLDEELTPDKERSLIQQFTKMVNRYIRLIAKDVGINKPITTYYARHSYATIMRRGGASTEFISEALGHTSIKTTASYLDSFDDDTKKKMQSILTNFKQVEH